MKILKSFSMVIVLGLFHQTVNARIINVPGDSLTIQRGIKGAVHGDTVLVAPGSYHENINFLGKRILLASHFILDSNRAVIDSTIIYGDAPAHPDTGSVVRFISGEDTNSVLCGFTIRGGTGTKIATPGYNLKRGGGIVCFNASPKIVNNIIANNVAYNGGGIFCWGTGAIIRSNVIKCNEAQWYDHLIGDGGGIYITHAGGVIIERNVIDTNYAYAYGAGILITFNSNGTKILNNTIIRNWVAADSGGPGAGICLYFDQNSQVRNNIVFQNRNHAGIYSHGSDATRISFNDVSDNPSGNFQFHDGSTGLGDTSWGKNCNKTPCDSFYNIIENPLFDSIGTNFLLQCSSPCIDAGSPSDSVLPGGGRYTDIGAKEYTYVCGDANVDGKRTVSDVVFKVNYLFKGGQAPCPLGRADDNRDCAIDVSDIVYEVNYLFKGGPPPVCGGN